MQTECFFIQANRHNLRTWRVQGQHNQTTRVLAEKWLFAVIRFLPQFCPFLNGSLLIVDKLKLESPQRVSHLESLPNQFSITLNAPCCYLFTLGIHLSTKDFTNLGCLNLKLRSFSPKRVSHLLTIQARIAGFHKLFPDNFTFRWNVLPPHLWSVHIFRNLKDLIIAFCYSSSFTHLPLAMGFVT